MSTFDVVIRGGTVATASDTFACDVGIRGGRIAALGHDLVPAGEVIDTAGKLVLPGGIDSHVHFAQPWDLSAAREIVSSGGARRSRA